MPITTANIRNDADASRSGQREPRSSMFGSFSAPTTAVGWAATTLRPSAASAACHIAWMDGYRLPCDASCAVPSTFCSCGDKSDTVSKISLASAA
jgi:hypothetical protein